ncbi:MAG: ABC transporter permease [Chloroflexota bacterium]
MAEALRKGFNILKPFAGRLVTVWVAGLLAFMILEMSPGDVIQTLVGDEASLEQISNLRQQLDLDRPLLIRYTDYILNFLRGDFGTSLVRGRPVLQLVGERFGNTLLLTFSSVLLASMFGVVFGMASAMRYRSLLDTSILIATTVFLAIPAFSSAILFVQLFSVHLGWLPAVGGSSLRHLILPTLSLSIPLASVITRLVRSRLIDELGQFYVTTAFAKGMTARQVWKNHILRNALTPAVTFIGLQIGHLLGGAVIVETVFAYPGVGRLIVQAIFDQDYPVVLAGVILLTLLFQMVNGLTDGIQRLIDPRIREGNETVC